MKIAGVEFKRIGIGRFFPKQDQVEIIVLFNDGSDKEVYKTVDANDPENAAYMIMENIKKLEKNIHESSENTDSILGSSLNIVIKNEDMLKREIPKFISLVKSKMDEIKKLKVAEGYLDLIREFKDMKLEF
jgi:hypothetical protein